MKFIIKHILIALTLITIIHESKCQRDVRKFRLSRVLENIIKKSSMQYEKEMDNEISRAFDWDCVKKFFKLPQNNKMIVQEIEEMVFMVTAGMKCSDEDKIFNSIFRQFVHDNFGGHLNCLKGHLKKLEPTSILVENFEINEDEMKECVKSFPISKEMPEFQEEMEKMVGPLNTYTCGAVSENGGNDFLVFISKGAIIEYGNITEELKKTEKEKLKEYLKDISIRTVNCVIKRYEDDPQAYSINDTLNYHYKKKLVPIKPEQEEPNDYVKRLIKLEGAIDNACVEKELNLEENGDKALLEVEATILFASAKSKCIRVDPVEFSDLFMDFAIENGQRHERYYSCAKYKLQKLEPTSKLAVTSSSDEPHEKYCRHFDIHIHPYSVWGYSDAVGQLNEATCGALTGDIVSVISLKTMLVFAEKDKELKINETRELFGTVTEKLHKLADCILERIK